MTETPPKAPLIAIADAPIPRNGAAYWIKSSDGMRLRAALFRPEGTPRGSLILSGGRTEPIEKYFETIGELQQRGFVVLAHDWRGQGLSSRLVSDPQLGHARGWRRFIGDFELLLSTFSPRLPKPWIAFGHSMGGALTALALAEGESRFSAVVLSAPMLGVSTGGRRLPAVQGLSFLMNFAGRSKVLAAPTDTHQDSFETNTLTHDRKRFERSRAQVQAEPQLGLGGVTWGWVAFALTVVQRIAVSKRIDTLPIPLLILGAEEEKLVVNKASEAVASRAPHGRYLEIKGAFHEILMETDPRRAQFWEEFDKLAEGIAPLKTAAKAELSKSASPKGTSSKTATAKPPKAAPPVKSASSAATGSATRKTKKLPKVASMEKTAPVKAQAPRKPKI